jgi:anti-anti-sigma regulatory factor
MAPALPTSTAELALVTESVLRVRFRPGVSVDAAAAQEIAELGLRMVAGRAHAVLVDARQLAFIDQRARDVLAGQSDPSLVAVALVVESTLQRTMGNIYLAVSRPRRVTRLFTLEGAALRWLEERLVQGVPL